MWPAMAEFGLECQVTADEVRWDSMGRGWAWRTWLGVTRYIEFRTDLAAMAWWVLSGRGTEGFG